MEKELCNALYRRVKEIAVKEFSDEALSDLLHGYLFVYSMVRVYPWLEEEFDDLWNIHERIREIGRRIQLLLQNRDSFVDKRAGFVVDLMDAYVLYSDLIFLDSALEIADEILIPHGSDRLILPCRTPNICRILCNYYYFTGEEEYAQLAKGLVTEALGEIRKKGIQEIISWWDALKAYENVVDVMQFSREDKEWFISEQKRYEASIVELERFELNELENMGRADELWWLARIFMLRMRRSFTDCIEGSFNGV